MNVVFTLIGFGLFVAGMAMGGPLNHFIDLPSVIIVLGPTVCLTSGYHSFGGLMSAIEAAIGTDPDVAVDAKNYIHTLSTARRIASGSGALGGLIGMVNMLAQMDDPTAIGPAMAVLLLSILYAVMLSELVLSPLLNRLYARCDGGAGAPTSPSGLLINSTALLAILMSFFVLVISLRG